MGNQSVISIEAVIDYIESHLDGKLELETVAEAVHYSKYHLHRLFTETVGMTIHDYVQRRQLTEAAKLLVFSDKPIIEIAFICGYESQQSFSLAFKAMYKSPPAEYREERSFYPLQLRFILHRRTTAMEFTIQDIRLAEKKDIVDWMNLMRLVIDGYPVMDEDDYLLGGLLVMSVIRSLGAGIQTPAVNAVIPQLVPEDQLMRYNGINATMQSIVNFAAPAAAGAVFAISTLRMTLMIDIVTAILGTGLLSCLALPKQNISIEKASVFSDMKIGVKYAFADKLIGKLLIIYGLFTFFCVPAGYLAGLLVRRVFGDTYWYLTAVEVVGFAGMMAGGVIMSTWGGFKHRGKTLAVGLFAFGSFAIGMGFSKNFIFYLGLMVCYGVALTMVQTVITTMLQEKTDTSMQGRVFGLLGTMYAGFLPIGMAMFGPLADILPLQWIMVGSGIALIVIAGIAYYSRELKTI